MSCKPLGYDQQEHAKQLSIRLGFWLSLKYVLWTETKLSICPGSASRHLPLSSQPCQLCSCP